MIYAMSDIHGYYQDYIMMLNKIKLQREDTLLILGDVIDRGEGGIRILLDMLERPNVRPFLGNHEAMMYFVLKELRKEESEQNKKWLKDMMADWTVYNGGEVTYREYLKLDAGTKDKVFQYLSEFDIYDELTVAGKRFFISHAGLGNFKKRKPLENYRLTDFIETRMDYNKTYFPDKIMLSGHTPTFTIDRKYGGKIYQKNNHIVIDCGVAYKGSLGCICLDTMEEFYVP